MARQKNPADVAKKHRDRTVSAQDEMIKGVKAVEVNPAEQAIAKGDKLRANWLKSYDNGKWKRGMERSTLDGWKKAMEEKGAPRVAAGLDASLGKTTQFFEQLLPFQADLQAKISNMPDLTIEHSVARSAEWIRGMAQFKRQR